MFERFTDRARNVLVLAQGQAHELGHNYIGTEHLLLGAILEGEGVAGRVLASFQISAEGVRAKVVELSAPDKVSAPSRRLNKPPFTPLAKKSLERALQEALGLGHNYIGTEHVLLALTHASAARSGAGASPDGMAARILSELGAEPEKVRACVLSTLQGLQASKSPGASQQALEAAVGALAPRPTWSPALAAAMAEVEGSLGPGETLTTSAVLEALARAADSHAGRVLSAAGLSPDRLAELTASVPLEGTSDLPAPPVSISVQDRTTVVDDPEVARFLLGASAEEIRQALRRGLPPTG